MMLSNQCPCGTGNTYSSCCGVFISGEKIPASPEQLMRSRYTAYHNHEFEYIGNTMLAPALDHFDINDLRESVPALQWTKLEVLKAFDNIVEFKAHYRLDNKQHVLHEISQFQFVNGKWYYTDGTFR